MTINIQEGKSCRDCGEWKPYTEYYSKRNSTYQSYCKPCFRLRNKKQYKDSNGGYAQKQRDRNARIKKQVYDAYGNKCACCGEANLLFLTIDHVNNDGADHRRQISPNARGNDPNSTGGIGMQLYYEIIREGFPDRFQILCYNCNCGKARNGGVCPHLN